MPAEMSGQRLPIPDKDYDPYTLVRQAGDYCGPDKGEYTDGVPAVWFLLPIARDKDASAAARSLHHVQSPPHIFTEEADGTLTIRESIGAGPRDAYYWHGYLTKGDWQLQP
jgi:hypothetical protein